MALNSLVDRLLFEQNVVRAKVVAPYCSAHRQTSSWVENVTDIRHCHCEPTFEDAILYQTKTETSTLNISLNGTKYSSSPLFKCPEHSLIVRKRLLKVAFHHLPLGIVTGWEEIKLKTSETQQLTVPPNYETMTRGLNTKEYNFQRQSKLGCF